MCKEGLPLFIPGMYPVFIPPPLFHGFWGSGLFSPVWKRTFVTYWAKFRSSQKTNVNEDNSVAETRDNLQIIPLIAEEEANWRGSGPKHSCWNSKQQVTRQWIREGDNQVWILLCFRRNDNTSQRGACGKETFSESTQQARKASLPGSTVLHKATNKRNGILEEFVLLLSGCVLVFRKKKTRIQNLFQIKKCGNELKRQKWILFLNMYLNCCFPLRCFRLHFHQWVQDCFRCCAHWLPERECCCRTVPTSARKSGVHGSLPEILPQTET